MTLLYVIDCLGRENLDTDCCTTANPCDYGKGDCDRWTNSFCLKYHSTKVLRNYEHFLNTIKLQLSEFLHFV